MDERTAKKVAELEARLDSFDAARRAAATEELAQLVESGAVECPEPAELVNLHAHSFYSYNAMGYSPSHIVWRAQCEGLAVIGLVDFDVLDGVDEFLRAGRRLGVPAVAGMETRAYIPELADGEINSPGEPGITYHMGVGFLGSKIDDPEAARFATTLRESARKRNMEMVRRVNPYLAPVELDYENDVLPLSPSGTPTERHLCLAYQEKAKAVFPDRGKRVAYWAEKLGASAGDMEQMVDDPVKLQATIRARTMKRGGVGYMKPAPESFPLMTDMNRFVARLGALPTVTWLDGTSPGESDPERLLDLHAAAGAAALNIIPDRNWNIKDAKVKALKVAKLHEIVRLADERGLPLSVGTEMNAPGLKFVDTFEAPELAPVRESFIRGAWVLRGHAVAMARDGQGYLSAWAREELADVHARNAHFERLGREAGANA